MRTIISAAAFVALLTVAHASAVSAKEATCAAPCAAPCEPSCGQDGPKCQDYVTCRPKGGKDCCEGSGCQDCCGKGCGKCKHCGRGWEGLDRHFNCQCGGSYKFPVPPLSTYHWPGIYSHQLMSEYHSPWRFPPIKAYEEEKLEPRETLPPANANAKLSISDDVQQVDFSAPNNSRPGESESMSNKLKKLSRYAP